MTQRHSRAGSGRSGTRRSAARSRSSIASPAARRQLRRSPTRSRCRAPPSRHGSRVRRRAGEERCDPLAHAPRCRLAARRARTRRRRAGRFGYRSDRVRARVRARRGSPPVRSPSGAGRDAGRRPRPSATSTVFSSTSVPPASARTRMPWMLSCRGRRRRATTTGWRPRSTAEPRRAETALLIAMTGSMRYRREARILR